MVSAQTECSVQVRRNAKGVLKDQRLRPRRDSPSGLRQVDVPVVRLTVDVNWPSASVTDCVGDDDMGGRGDQHLITGSNVEGTKQPIETNTAGGKTGSEAHSDEAREGGLVFGYRRALDGAPGLQQEPQRHRTVTPARGPAQQRELATAEHRSHMNRYTAAPRPAVHASGSRRQAASAAGRTKPDLVATSPTCWTGG